jgi:hypothetical protein
MRNIAKTLVFGLFACAMAGAPILAQTIAIDYDHSINFLKFRTFTWARVHATDPRVEVRITSALNRDMAGRYMTEVPKYGDVTITAVQASQDKQEYATFYDSLGSDYFWRRAWSSGFMDSLATPGDVPVDTLIIDMYDTKIHTLLWRGTITLSPADANSKEADQKYDKAVTQLIGKYPPKFKK